jgi:hypothetical protein
MEEEKRRKEKRKEERKKITVGKEGFSEAGPTLLTMQQITAVRCN